ncbi:unnamed protein product [Urochloa decumbens]|uniref:Uncharacterized protein n=1 Tax=Urochloa decumbens TaxID=240449 RepID=A0ABC9GGM0_9POAL
MEGIMVSAATGAMNSLLTKLTALMGEEYKAQKGVSRDIAFLRDELSSMNALLEKLAGMEIHDPQVREWRNQVREMAYDIEDYIDIHIFRLHRELGKPTGVKEFFRRSVQKVKDFGAEREIAGHIQELKAGIVVASQRRDRYWLDEVVSSGSANCESIDPRLPALYVEAANLVGIDGPREDLINLITDEELSVRVVSIVGFGGSGKTTLAKQVYTKIGGQFKCEAFVSVSQNPDIKKIFRALLSQMKKEDYDITKQSDEESLINALREFLKDKRYIIVIDDIWDIQAWKTIKCALPENSFCSRIIVTTRNINVAKSCCSPYDSLAFNVRPLNDADSKTLFYRRVFGSENKCSLHLKEVSTEIIKKCGGLPLAIITMASLLSTKSDSKEEWVSVRNSIGLGLEKNPDVEEMRAILSLSYNDLPLHLKTCLLYLAVYPEDYEIQMEDLVRRWIAEGFVKVEGRRNLMDEGKHYFNELINRSMIQPLDVSYNGQAMGCLVHDMILDIIKSKAVEENFITFCGDEPQVLIYKNKVRRLSINYHGPNVMTVSTMITANIRSLSIFGYVLQMPPVLEFPALRVLALDRSQKLESDYLKNIGKLFLLRYLRIQGSNITQLPEQIGELQCLEILDLHGTSIRQLPSSIVKLRQLKWMLTDGVTLPRSVGKMQGLEELSSIVVDDCTPLDSLQELGSLTRLRTLGIKWCISDSHVQKIAYVHNLVSSLGKLGCSNLHHLHVKTDGRLVHIPLDSWSPPPHMLHELISTSDLYICKIPEWLTSIVNLNYLQISISKLRQETLNVLGDLPTLLSLILYSHEPEPKERLVICHNMFQCLKRLLLYCEVGLLMFEAGAMPRLQALEFQIMANEVRSVCNAPDLGICHLSSLSNLYVWIDCGDARAEEVHALEAAIRASAKLLPKCPTPYFHRLYRREE